LHIHPGSVAGIILGVEGERAEAEWNDIFSAYAQAFPELAEELQQLMCAEAAPWRCHRSLIADVLIFASD
jgi:transketolase